MKECLFYTKLDDGAVRCDLCPHLCHIKDGGTGLCRSRVNHSGKLYAMSYGQPCSLAIDPIEKKPLYFFILGKNACRLHARDATSDARDARTTKSHKSHLSTLSIMN